MALGLIRLTALGETNRACRNPPSVNLHSVTTVSEVVPAFWLPPSTSWNGPFVAGPNDGGVKRGDREDTGDNQADLDEMGSGPAQPTVDPTSLGGTSSIDQTEDAGFDSSIELTDLDDMEIMQADDGRLGLTGLKGSGDEDEIADSGPTENPLGE